MKKQHTQSSIESERLWEKNPAKATTSNLEIPQKTGFRFEYQIRLLRAVLCNLRWLSSKARQFGNITDITGKS